MLQTVFAAFVSLFVMSSHKIPAKKVEPVITSHVQHPTENCTPDPLSPCISENLTILNPLYKPVLTEIDCGQENRGIVVQIPPRMVLSVDLEFTAPMIDECRIVKWSVVPNP